jgi:hypothetical protein
MSIEELLCINEQQEFIVELDIKDIYYLLKIFNSNDKYKKQISKDNSILQQGIFSLNIIYLETYEELFDFSLLYLEKIEEEIKKNKITEQKYIILTNYLKKIIELKNKMLKNNFVYNEDELIIYKNYDKYIYEFYF